MRVEEVFGIDISDSDAGLVVTVGDPYRLILKMLNIPYEHAPEHGRDRLKIPESTAWKAEDVWVTLKAIIEDQLQVDSDEVRELASFQQDLGID